MVRSGMRYGRLVRSVICITAWLVIGGALAASGVPMTKVVLVLPFILALYFVLAWMPPFAKRPDGR
jgi:hypothetical protein